MESLHCLKYFLEKNDFLCKIDVKDAYFSLPLCMSSGKFVRFAWSGNLYEFHGPCFGLGPAPIIFSKVPIALLRRLNIPLVIYLDDILLTRRTLGSFNEPRHIDFSASTSGFCHKYEKISSETTTANSVFKPKN